MAKVVIFGTGDLAIQAHYYFENDSPHEIVGFTVSDDQVKSEHFLGLPLVEFSTVEKSFDPAEFHIFVAMSGRRMNRDRAQFYWEAKQKGYGLVSYVSSKAILCDNQVGENCFILENTNIQPFVTIGNNVTIWCASHIGHHTNISDHVFISSMVGLSGRCSISDNCYLSGKSGVDSNVALAEGTLVGLGSIVTRDTEPWGIYTGNPARKRKTSSKDFSFL